MHEKARNVLDFLQEKKTKLGEIRSPPLAFEFKFKVGKTLKVSLGTERRWVSRVCNLVQYAVSLNICFFVEVLDQRRSGL